MAVNARSAALLPAHAPFDALPSGVLANVLTHLPVTELLTHVPQVSREFRSGAALALEALTTLSVKLKPGFEEYPLDDRMGRFLEARVCYLPPFRVVHRPGRGRRSVVRADTATNLERVLSSCPNVEALMVDVQCSPTMPNRRMTPSADYDFHPVLFFPTTPRAIAVLQNLKALVVGGGSNQEEILSWAVQCPALEFLTMGRNADVVGPAQYDDFDEEYVVSWSPFCDMWLLSDALHTPEIKAGPDSFDDITALDLLQTMCPHLKTLPDLHTGWPGDLGWRADLIDYFIDTLSSWPTLEEVHLDCSASVEVFLHIVDDMTPYFNQTGNAGKFTGVLHLSTSLNLWEMDWGQNVPLSRLWSDKLGFDNFEDWHGDDWEDEVTYEFSDHVVGVIAFYRCEV